MNSATHIAGPHFHKGRRVIQRCMVCGMKIVDSRDLDVPRRADGIPLHVGTFKCGAFVRVRNVGGVRTWRVVKRDSLPGDFCLEMVE